MYSIERETTSLLHSEKSLAILGLFPHYSHAHLYKHRMNYLLNFVVGIIYIQPLSLSPLYFGASLKNDKFLCL